MLLHSERFGILLPFNLDDGVTVESDNIGMKNYNVISISESNDLLTEIATVLVSASNTEDLSSFNPAIQNSILIPEEFIRQRSLITGMHLYCILLCCVNI